MKKLTLLLCFAIQVAACASEKSTSGSSIAVGTVIAVEQIARNDVPEKADTVFDDNKSHLSSTSGDPWNILDVAIDVAIDKMVNGLLGDEVIEYTIKFDNGRVIAITEDQDKHFQIGQRVVVERALDGSSQIVAY